MSASDGGADIDRGLEFINRGSRFRTVGAAFLAVINGIILFIGASIATVGDAAVNVWVTILSAIGLAGESSIRAFFINPFQFVGGSFELSEQALAQPPWSFLGPFIAVLGVGIALFVLLLVTGFLDARNSDVPGLGLDLPDIIAGNDEDGRPDEGSG